MLCLAAPEKVSALNLKRLKADNKTCGRSQKNTTTLWCPLTGVTLQVSEPPADIASAVSAGDFFLSHAPLAVD